MCIITDENHIVISVSLIPGNANIPSIWHVYFPVIGESRLPQIGEVYNPKEVICPQK